MRVTLEPATITKLLSKVVSVLKADPVSGSTARGFGRLQVGGGRLCATATGPTMAMTASVPFDDDGAEEGACGCNLESMADMLKFAPSGEKVTLDYRGDAGAASFLLVKVGRSKFKSACLHPEVFKPVQPSGTGFLKMDSETLAAALAAVEFASMPSDADNVRCNILLTSFGGKVYAAATNGIECCILETQSLSESGRCFVPAKVSRCLSKALDHGEVAIMLADQHVCLVQEGCVLRFSKPLEAEARFPDLTKLLAVKHVGRAEAVAERLRDAVMACKQVSKDELLMGLKGSDLTLWARSQLDGSEYSGVEAVVREGDAVIEAGMCPTLMAEFLSRVKTEKVTLEFSTTNNDRGWPIHVKMTDGERLTFLVKSLAVMTASPT